MAIDSPAILTHTLIHIYKRVPRLWQNNLLKFPKGKDQAEIQKVETETARWGSALRETGQEENVRIDISRQLPSNTTHPYREQRAMGNVW